LEISSQSALTIQNSVQIFTTGGKFFEQMKEDLSKAEKSINLEYYIFHYGKLSEEICNILIKKAMEGVEVKIIIDGASSVKKAMLKELVNANCKVKRFFPWHPLLLKLASLRVNYRNHRKLTLIDDKIGYIGGFNIGDEYLGNGPLGHWRDTSIRICGECVLELQKEFYFSWGIVNKREALNSLEIPYKTDINDVLSHEQALDITYMQVVSSGPNYEYRTMRDNFLKIILEAQRYIFIQTPYFVPDEILLEALKVAATSGVKIRIMIPSVADHIFMKWVNQYFAGELLNLGVEIYRYTNGFIHAKMVIADDEIATIGSANMDYRSLYQNFEVNVNIYDQEIVKKFHQIFMRDIQFSVRLFKSQYVRRSFWTKCKESVFRLLAPIL
jgi:cardiolipin synthase